MNQAFIYEAIRTPRGRGEMTGALSGVRPVELVGQLLSTLAERGADPTRVDDVILGCATQVGDQGANVARTAALWAGWPDQVPGLTVSRLGSSGLDAIGLAAARVISGMDQLVVAGGVESMSRVPLLADRGARTSDPQVAERTSFVPMELAADLLATLDGRRRDELDLWAVRSHRRAEAAWEVGAFARSVIPVRGPDGRVLLARDEPILPALELSALAAHEPLNQGLVTEESLAVIRRRFPEVSEIQLLHTRATAPAVVDGAALVLVGNEEVGRALGLTPRARIRSYAAASVDPILMLTAPVPATEKALRLAAVEPGEVDVFEVNEAFSAPVLHYVAALGIDDARVNVHGGALAMGHPVGASGAILVGTLLDTLDEADDRLGVVALSAAAGLGAAAVLERVDGF